jgi:hypothetical protein
VRRFFLRDPTARFETSRERVKNRNSLVLGRLPERRLRRTVDPCVLCRVRSRSARGKDTDPLRHCTLRKAVGCVQRGGAILKLPRGRSVGRIDGCARQLKMDTRNWKRVLFFCAFGVPSNQRVLTASRGRKPGGAGGTLAVWNIRRPADSCRSCSDVAAAEQALTLVKQQRFSP